MKMIKKLLSLLLILCVVLSMLPAAVLFTGATELPMEEQSGNEAGGSEAALSDEQGDGSDSAETYTVRFMEDGVVTTTVTCSAGETINMAWPTYFTNGCYAFSCWSTTAAFSGDPAHLLELGDDYTVNGDMTFYAVYILYDLNYSEPYILQLKDQVDPYIYVGTKALDANGDDLGCLTAVNSIEQAARFDLARTSNDDLYYIDSGKVIYVYQNVSNDGLLFSDSTLNGYNWLLEEADDGTVTLQATSGTGLYLGYDAVTNSFNILDESYPHEFLLTMAKDYTTDPIAPEEPMLVNDTVTIYDNVTPVTIDVLANDTKLPDGAVICGLGETASQIKTELVTADVAIGTYGSASVVDGKVVFTPGAEVEIGDEIVFCYAVEKDGRYYFAMVTVTVEKNGAEGTLTTDTLVVDFGIPVTFDPVANDTGDFVGAAVKGLRAATDGADSLRLDFSEGYAVLNEDGTVTFTPTKIMTAPVVFYYSLQYGQDIHTGTIQIVPATNVYYEDSMDGIFTFGPEGAWKTLGTTAEIQQSADFAGDIANGVYGYDDAYKGFATYSMGSAHMVTVDKNLTLATVDFSFYGTGFDVISLVSGESGYLIVAVCDYETGALVSRYVVDTYYGFTYSEAGEPLLNAEGEQVYEYVEVEQGMGDYAIGEAMAAPEGAEVLESLNGMVRYFEYVGDGEGNYVKEPVIVHWIPTAEAAASHTFYQVPVMKIMDLPADLYKVSIASFYSPLYDHGSDYGKDAEADQSYQFVFDAVRVYDPCGENEVATDAYRADGENKPHYINLHEALIEDAITESSKPSGSGCSHSGETTTETVESTCTSQGSVTVICDDCGETIRTEILPVLQHEYSAAIIPPTCTTEGYTSYGCMNCGYSYTANTVPATGHLNTSIQTIFNGCTEDEVRITTCEDCGETVSTETIPASGHNYSYTIDVIDANCHLMSCTRCGASKTEVHNYVNQSCICGAKTMRIYFQNEWYWSDVCLYFWYSNIINNYGTPWPGAKMTLIGKNSGNNNFDVYMMEVPTHIKGMTINGYKNDGSGSRDQSPDITSGWYDGICYYMYWDNGNKVGSFDAGDIPGLGISSVTETQLPYEQDNAKPLDEGYGLGGAVSLTVDTCAEGQLSGSCGAEGDNVTWSFDPTTGTLRLEGTGATANYTYNQYATVPTGTMPWFELWDEIQHIEISDGITSLGNYIFRGCSNVTELNIPSSVTALGTHALSHMNGLTQLTIPGSVQTLGSSAVYSCLNLKTVILEEDVPKISFLMFGDCEALTTIYIPKSVTDIDSGAFDGCGYLTDVYYGGGQAQWDAIPRKIGNEYLFGAAIHFCSHDELIPTGEVVPPTCTENGYTVYICAGCGETVHGDIQPAFGHDYIYTDLGDEHSFYCANNCGSSGIEPHVYHDGFCICGSKFFEGLALGIVFIDGNETASLAEYEAHGPNNEIYLDKKQAVAFNLRFNTQPQTIQIGLKSVWGDDAVDKASWFVITCGTNRRTFKITTATEMYYDITDIIPLSMNDSGEYVSAAPVIITKTNGDLGSLTYLKWTVVADNLITDDSASTFVDKGNIGQILDQVDEIVGNTQPAEDEETVAPPTEEAETEVNPAAVGFTDLAADAWYYEGVAYAVEHGLMRGMSETEFMPHETLTRAMLVTVLYRQAGEPAVESIEAPAFADVAADAWYYNAVVWAYEEGITTGLTSTEFGPHEAVTRQQLVTFLWRAAGEPAAVLGYGESAPADTAAVASYAQTAMAWAYENDIIKGEDGLLKPRTNATRAQIASIFMRYENTLAMLSGM